MAERGPPTGEAGGDGRSGDLPSPASLLRVHGLAMSELERLRRLASFPEQNPNPVFETDLSGAATYANPAADALAGELGVPTIAALLAPCLTALLGELDGAGGKPVQRELDWSGRAFSGTFYLVADPPRIRAFLRETTGQKAAEAARLAADRELAIHNRVADAFLTVPDDELYGVVLGILLSAFGSRLGGFGYIDEDGALVVPSMTRHAWDKCQVPDKTIKFPKETWGQSSWPTAIREKRPVWSNEPSTRVPEGHIPVRRHISMPILHNGEAIGLLQMANREADYTEEDVQAIRLVADHMAPTLHARLERDRHERERRRAEAALGSSELHFKTLAETIPQLVWTCRGDGPCDYLSQQWIDYTGIPAERQLGYGWLDRLHPDDRAPTIAAWERAVKENTDFNVEFRIRRKDGEYRWFKARAVALRDGAGGIQKWFGSNTDIEDMKRAQAELAAHRDRLESLVADRTRDLAASNRELGAEMAERRKAEDERDRLFDLSLDMFCVAGFDGYLKLVNPAFPRTLGWAPEELLAAPFIEFVHPDDREPTLLALEGLSRGEAVPDFENRYRTRDGSYRWMSWTARPAVEKGLCYAVARDITRRKEAGRLLSKEAERTGLLFRMHRDALELCERELYDLVLERAVALTDSEIGFFHRVSDDQREIALVTWNKGARKACTAAFDEHYPVERAGSWADILREKRPVVYNDYASSPNRKGLPEGHAPVRRFMSIPVIEDGKVRLILGVGNKALDYDQHDVDDIQLVANELHKIMTLRRLDAELRQTVSQLRASNAELESFAYSVSHDLRAPLRAMDGFAQALQEEHGDRLDGTGREYLEKVRVASARMSTLIDDLLGLSRVTRADMRRESVDLSALAAQTLKGLSGSEPGRKVRTGILAGLVVDGDPDLLRLMMENLLSNAWKFTSRTDQAFIEFGAETAEEKRVFFVRDNGVGFDMKYAGKLFAPFQRLHSTADFPGTGIGLATVQRVVHRHGGRVWAESGPGKGATFKFTLEGG